METVAALLVVLNLAAREQVVDIKNVESMSICWKMIANWTLINIEKDNTGTVMFCVPEKRFYNWPAPSELIAETDSAWAFMEKTNREELRREWFEDWLRETREQNKILERTIELFNNDGTMTAHAVTTFSLLS